MNTARKLTPLLLLAGAFLLSGVASAQQQFVTSAMTGTSGVDLSTLPASPGGTWTLGNTVTAHLIENGTGTGVRIATSLQSTQYYNSATPTSANYTAQATIVPEGTLSTTADGAGVTIRESSTAYTFYGFAYIKYYGAYCFFKTVAGTVTQIAQFGGPTPATGTPLVLALSGNGSTFNCYVNGYLAGTATDSSITAAGYAGVYVGAQTAGDTNSFAVKSFEAYYNPSIAVSPTTASTSNNETITLTGTNVSNWSTSPPTVTTTLGTLSAETATSSSTATFTFAPGSSAGTATLTDTSDGFQISATITVAVGGLSVGTVSAMPVPTGIQLSVSAGLSGGSGTGYTYKIYRGTTPVIATSGGATFTTATMPYIDTTAVAGTTYFYKIVGVDSASDVAYVAPAGLGSVSTATSLDLAVAAVYSTQILNIVYMGDSITAGTANSSPSTTAPPVMCSQYLGGMFGIRNVYFSNQGNSGFDTDDFLPTVNSNTCFTNSVAAATSLEAAQPSGQLIFSIQLGTNDSASSGQTGGAVTAAQLGSNLETIISTLLTDFPSAKVVVNTPPLYTANSQTSYDYEETGLQRLLTFYPEYPVVVAAENVTYPGHVFLGDTTAAAFFAPIYQTEMVAGSGSYGTYYLHPNVQGSADLGRLWANAIYKDLFGTSAFGGRGRTLN